MSPELQEYTAAVVEGPDFSRLVASREFLTNPVTVVNEFRQAFREYALGLWFSMQQNRLFHSPYYHVMDHVTKHEAVLMPCT